MIGLRGEGQGSLAAFGVLHDELPLTATGLVDDAWLAEALAVPTRLVLIQRSCGYSCRPSLSVAQIGHLVERACSCPPDRG